MFFNRIIDLIENVEDLKGKMTIAHDDPIFNMLIFVWFE